MTTPTFTNMGTPGQSQATEGAVDLSQLRKSDEYNKLVRWVSGQYDIIRQARMKTEQQWYLNLAFYKGQQNVVPYGSATSAVGNTAGRLAVPKAPYWRARPITNKVRPIIRTELAKLTAQKPSASVIPASSDDNDLFAAQAGEQIWESIYADKHINRTLRSALFWTCITGTGFIKDWWNPNAQDVASDQMGDIIIRPETPWHVMIPDFREETLEGQPYLIHASTKSLDWVQMHYKTALDGKELKPNVKGQDEILSNAFLSLIDAKTLQNDAVLCLEAWIKPGAIKMFPQGALVTVVGDDIVAASEGWPFQHGQFPFSKIEHIPSGQFYADSIITDLISLQREYNRTRGQIIESKNRMAKPQLAAPLGSIDPAQITSEPGQVILYKQGFTPPSPIPLVSLPSYVLQELDRIDSDMNDISGQHEVSKGNAPPGVTAATAISYLQEQDDSKLSHTIDSIENAMENLGAHVLSHVVQFWDTQRVVKVTGQDGFFDAITLQGSDLRGNTDIRIEAGSALPTSKAAKQAFIMDLMKMGFIDPNKGLEVMEIGGVNKLYEQVQIDSRQAQRENLKMQKLDPQMLMQQAQQAEQMAAMQGATGQPFAPPPPVVPVNTWDNHAVHVELHNRFRKSQSFEMLPEEIRQQFEQHVQMHVLAQQVQPPLVQATQQGGQDATMAAQEQQSPEVAQGGDIASG